MATQVQPSALAGAVLVNPEALPATTEAPSGWFSFCKWRHHAKSVDNSEAGESQAELTPEAKKNYMMQFWHKRGFKDVPEFTVKEGESHREARKRWFREFRETDSFKEMATQRHCHLSRWCSKTRAQISPQPFKPWYGWDCKRDEA